MLLSGEVDLILPEDSGAGRDHRRRLTAGRFVYYPADFPHTLRTVSPQPANYLMFKWSSSSGYRGRLLPFGEFESNASGGGDEVGAGFSARLVFEGRTRHLRKVHCHVTRLVPGGGYELHTDAHDVAIVLLEGRTETLGERITAPCVVFCASGEPHGIRNVGDNRARYLVFEFHGGSDPPFWRKALNPQRWRRMAEGLFGRRG